jgi:uncharacterized protein YkwD
MKHKKFKGIISLAIFITILLSFNVKAVDNSTMMQIQNQSFYIDSKLINQRKTEIFKEYIKTYPDIKSSFYYNDGKNIYDVEPSIVAPYSAGVINKSALNKGLNMVNFARFLSYLPNDVTLDDALVTKAQHGAVLLAANKKLSHTPPKPADMSEDIYKIGYSSTSSSNIAMGYGSIQSSIINGYMRDEDAGNISRVGHRRWLMNPPLKNIGFGYAGSYSTTQVFDRSRAEKVIYDFISWPSSLVFPKEVFSKEDPWSITLNPEKYNNQKVNEITVKLVRNIDNKSWIFNWEDKDENNVKTGKEYFNVDTGGYGVPFCIIFKPDTAELKDYSEGERFTVTIDGLYTTNNEKTQLSFTTEFFSLLKFENSVKSQIKDNIKTALEVKNFARFQIAYGSIMEYLDTNSEERDLYLSQISGLWNDVNTVDIIAVRKEMQKLADTRDLGAYNKILYELVDTIKDPDNRAYVLGELAGWGHDYIWTSNVVKAVEAVNSAWAAKSEQSKKIALELIKSVESEATRNFLIAEVNSIVIKP